MKKLLFYLLSFFLISGCSNSEDIKQSEIKKKNAKAEYILRHNNSCFFKIFPPDVRIKEPYPWEEQMIGDIPRITKEFFRCKGSSLNLPIVDYTNPEKPETYEDCKGPSSHSLFLIHGKEGVYPVLIDILNFLQEKTRKKVIITCGYRCPLHNKYCDRSLQAKVSKHMIGAEVDFYVQGMEYQPEEVIDLIFQFYKERKRNI